MFIAVIAITASAASFVLDFDGDTQQRDLAERIKILNRCRVGLRKGINAEV